MESTVEDISLGNCGQMLSKVTELIQPMHNLKQLGSEAYFGIDEDISEQREAITRTRARLIRNAMLIEDVKGLESKTTIEPKDCIRSVLGTVWTRAPELAHDF